MLIALVVSGIVSGALVVGAAWGAIGPLPDRLQGFLVALAGGSLVLSLVTELIQPSVEESTVWLVAAFLAFGALVFTGVDYLVDEKWGSDSGGGLLAAISLDGLPENLALGVALIGVGPKEVAALAGSILLSNLPEAAGGAKQMVDNGRGRRSVLGLWSATAVILSVAALVGYFALDSAPEEVLAAVRSFAAGAVVASLATEVFPTAYREDQHLAGVATTLGLILALLLGQLA